MRVCLAVLFTLGLTMVGCSGGGGSSKTKGLFSVWTRPDNSLTIDMSSMTFGTQTVRVTLSGGEQCECSVTLTGGQTSGLYSIDDSTYVPSTGGGSDPGCSALDESGTYRNENATLTLCASINDCWSYN